MNTIQEKAQYYLDLLVEGKRQDGATYLYFEDHDKTQPLSYAVHNQGEYLPDDYKYTFLQQALEIIANSAEDDLDCPQLEPDIYTHDLTKWLHSNPQRYYYTDQYIQDFGPPEGDNPTITLLQGGQVLEMEEVFHLTLNFLQSETQGE